MSAQVHFDVIIFLQCAPLQFNIHQLSCPYLSKFQSNVYKHVCTSERLLFKTCVQKCYLIVLVFIKVKARDIFKLSLSHQPVFLIQNAHNFF